MSITAKTREAHRSNPEQYNPYSEGQTPSVPLGLVELLVTPKSFTQVNYSLEALKPKVESLSCG